MQRTKLDFFPNRSASAEEKQKRKIRRGEWKRQDKTQQKQVSPAYKADDNEWKLSTQTDCTHLLYRSMSN